MTEQTIKDPKEFLDSICESISGIRKIYISDVQGSILAESSNPQDQFDLSLVRSFPMYFDRLGKFSFGSGQSMVIEMDGWAAVLFVSSPLYLTFICDEDANFALIQSLTDDMKAFLGQQIEMIEFLDQLKHTANE